MILVSEQQRFLSLGKERMRHGVMLSGLGDPLGEEVSSSVPQGGTAPAWVAPTLQAGGDVFGIFARFFGSRVPTAGTPPTTPATQPPMEVLGLPVAVVAIGGAGLVGFIAWRMLRKKR